MTPTKLDEMQNAAYQRYQAGDLASADQLCRQVLQHDPRRAEIVYLLGVIAHDRGRLEQAMAIYQEAERLAPDKSAVFVNARGEALMLLNRHDEALVCFRRAIELRPTYERAYNNAGRVLHGRDDFAGAQANFAQAVRLNPNYATAHNNLGAVLQAQNKLDEAAAQFNKAISLRPDYPEAHFNLGSVLHAKGDPVGAALHFKKAIEFRPTYARAFLQLGQALERLRRDYDALAAYQEAARLQPNDVESQIRMGDFLMLKGDWPEAIAALERARVLKPDDAEPFARLFYGRQLVCDWRHYDADLPRLWTDAERIMAEGKAPVVTPFQAITLPWTLPQLLAVTRSQCEQVVRHQREYGMTRKFPHPRTRGGRLRVGYVSGDFYDHPISHLLHGLFGCHDRTQVEVFAYGFGQADKSVYRQRILAEVEHFVDVSAMSLPGLAQSISDDGVHVLVDLMGHTGVNRLGMFALKPAPIQVNFLGMLGTIGADFIDYLIGDRTITPPEFAPHFLEKFVTMPHSYLIAQPIELPQGQVRRSDYGLPEEGFVFCSFNSPYKLEPRIFEAWMRILGQVPGSVLWLYTNGELLESNLRRQAQTLGISPDRLVFASFVPRPEHTLRHKAADLFLDTLLYNGAATASLALQLELPVLTCLGNSFASRIGASLLNTVEMPELIAPSLEEYERLAVRLANSPDELKGYRQRLAAGRTTSPLYDTPRFVKNLERAYQAMWDIHASGRGPEAIVVRE